MESILEYVECEAGDTAPALRLLDEFHAAFRALAQSPHIGKQRESLTGAGTRWWAVHSYLVLYAPETTPVRIIRIIHGARDLERMLRAL